MLCREDHQVGAQQADKRGERCAAAAAAVACLLCVRHLPHFQSWRSQKFGRNLLLYLIQFSFFFSLSLTLWLLRQKGQHLEPFIQSFFNSCESPKPKPSRPELTILSPTSENDKKVRQLFLK